MLSGNVSRKWTTNTVLLAVISVAEPPPDIPRSFYCTQEDESISSLSLLNVSSSPSIFALCVDWQGAFSVLNGSAHTHTHIHKSEGLVLSMAPSHAHHTPQYTNNKVLSIGLLRCHRALSRLHSVLNFLNCVCRIDSKNEQLL